MMQSKWHKNNRSQLILIAATICSSTVTLTFADFRYFNQPEMDFWKKPEPKSPSLKVQTPKPQPTSGSLPHSADSSQSAFPWQKYGDPKNDEFFREGDYLPPAPFMEIARNPTDENIDHWFKYLEAKNEVTRRLQAKLTDYVTKHPSSAVPSSVASSLPNSGVNAEAAGGEVDLQKMLKGFPESQAISADAKRFRLRLYFDSKCPHCKRMIETMQGLSQKGFFIELRQVDADLQARSRIPFPVTSTSPSELKQYHIESVPVLLVGDLTARTYFKVQGYQSESSVLAALSEAVTKNSTKNKRED